MTEPKAPVQIVLRRVAWSENLKRQIKIC